jgi:MFS family permease
LKWCVAVYAVAALGAVLVSGRISDVVGRKPVLLAALLAMIVGLGVFLVADDMALLLVARTIHGAAVGSIVVAGAAALLDLRPDHGARSGQFSGVSFNIGMTVAILGSAVLAQYAPHPMRTPYAVVAVICAVVGIGVVAMREPHSARTRGPIPIAKPAVPREIRGDFWFAALGVMASWSVLAAAALLGATFGLGFGGSLRHLANVVPADRRGETMSAYYLLAYTAMAVPTIVAGWAATRWPLSAVFPWFAGAAAVACIVAAVVGAISTRGRQAADVTR